MSHSLEDTMPLVRYRLAYGLATRAMELRRGSEVATRWQRDATSEVLAEVARQLGSPAEEIREAVEDAIARRSPKW